MQELYIGEQVAFRERLKPVEQYRPVMVGGRIKTAGVSFNHLYNAAAPLIAEPESADAAFAASKNFARLKENPSLPFRVAFFPQDEGQMRAAFRGLGIYRPTIKTDQGPAGNVGYFHIEGATQAQPTGRIAKEEGVALVERFLDRRFQEATFPDDVEREITAAIFTVQDQYQVGNYRGADEGLRKLRELSLSQGIETTRRAGVGRGEFFFFRPVQTEEPVIIGQDLIDGISAKTQEVVGSIEHLASLTKRFMREGLSLEEAMKRARQGERFYNRTDESGLLYFQPDVLIRKDGSFDIERVNMPDLGMFFTQIEATSNNGTFEAIKDINTKIAGEVLDVVAENTGRNVVLVTRDEVLNNNEDTLEFLELVAFTRGLQERGKETVIAPLAVINQLPQDSSVLLMNIAPRGEEFNQLLHRVAQGEVQCYPDPFIKLFEKEATTFERKKIDDRILDKFLKVIAPGALNEPKGVHARYKAIQNALKLGGVDNDIVYFNINGNGTQVPTFRYDVKSFFEVQKAVETQRRQVNHVSLTAIPVPFKQEDVVIEGPDGPRLALFRFMYVRK